MKVWLVYSEDDGPEEAAVFSTKEAAQQYLMNEHDIEEWQLYEEALKEVGYWLVELEVQ